MNIMSKLIYCLSPLLGIAAILYFLKEDKHSQPLLLEEIIANRMMLDEISEDLWRLKKRIYVLEKEYRIDCLCKTPNNEDI